VVKRLKVKECLFIHGHNAKVDWCNYRTLKTKNMFNSVQKRWSDSVYREKHVKSYFDATILRYEDSVWKEFHSKRCKEGGQKRKENPENALKSKQNFKKATEHQQDLRKNDSEWVGMFSKSISDSWRVTDPINIAKFQVVSDYALENKMKFSVFSEKNLFIDGSNLFFN